MLTVLDLAYEDTQLKKKSYKEYAGPCPDSACRCQHDGFSVKWNGEKHVFQCRGCRDASESVASGRKRGWGDVADYLIHYRQVTPLAAFCQALAEGDIEFEEAYKRLASVARLPYEVTAAQLQKAGADPGQAERQEARTRRRVAASLDYHAPEWQEATHDAVKRCEAALWSDAGVYALNYVRSRGFTDEMIRAAHMGYSEQGGIPRLIIPSYVARQRQYVAIYRRDLRADVPHGERWKDAPGSTKNTLYGADCLTRKLPTILCEGPLDALSVVQECGLANYNVVAVAGIDCGREIENLAALALMPLVLVAFDAEHGKNKGDEAAAWWLKRLKNARRLRPILHDVNDMLVHNWDIKAWVEQCMGISTEQDEEQGDDRQLEQDEVVWFSQEICITCLDTLDQETPATYEYEGTMYCAAHWPGNAITSGVA